MGDSPSSASTVANDWEMIRQSPDIFTLIEKMNSDDTEEMSNQRVLTATPVDAMTGLAASPTKSHDDTQMADTSSTAVELPSSPLLPSATLDTIIPKNTPTKSQSETRLTNSSSTAVAAPPDVPPPPRKAESDAAKSSSHSDTNSHGQDMELMSSIIARMNQRHKDQQSTIQEAAAKLATLQRQSETEMEHLQELSFLRKRVLRQKNEIQRKASWLSDLRDKKEAYATLAKDLYGQTVLLNHELDEQNKSIATLEAKLAETTAQIHALEHELSLATTQLSESTTLNTNLKEVLSRLQLQRDIAVQLLGQRDTAIRVKNQRIEELETEIAQLKKDKETQQVPQQQILPKTRAPGQVPAIYANRTAITGVQQDQEVRSVSTPYRPPHRSEHQALTAPFICTPAARHVSAVHAQQAPAIPSSRARDFSPIGTTQQFPTIPATRARYYWPAGTQQAPTTPSNRPRNVSSALGNETRRASGLSASRHFSAAIDNNNKRVVSQSPLKNANMKSSYDKKQQRK